MYILALDQGTTSSRAMVFDKAGKVISVAQKEFTQYYPQPGWVEHDPEEIWNSQLSVARAALDQKNINASEIAAIGITNQRETTVVWDKRTGKPLYNAIVWQDRRTAPFCDNLRADGKDAVIKQKTGLITDAYFSGTKLNWILQNVPAAADCAGNLAFGTIDSWLLWKLTGGRVHATDASNASRTMLFNIHSGAWDDEMLQLLNIPSDVLPEVKDSSCFFGNTDLSVFGAAIPVCGIAGDQQAALFGQLCTEPGMVKNTYGTGCFMMMNTGDSPVSSKNNLLSTVAWQLNGVRTYALEGSVFVAGAVIQWLRDELGIIKSADETESLAKSILSTDGVYLVPAFTGLGSPHWDSYARGLLIGLTRGSGRAHIVRAALESIAYQSSEVVFAMEADAGAALKELRVDGGASKNNFLMQFQADLIGCKTVRPANNETTALGAAYLAGLGSGFWKNVDELRHIWVPDKYYTPGFSKAEREKRFAEWTRAVERSKNWILTHNEPQQSP